MFDKILIANRGEIACRIIRTARRMGIATVAVYSDADADALHVRMADEAVHLGPAPAAESYLVGKKILNACWKTGAQAVHPGYGFLSENAGFARLCADTGVVFIGPPVAAIEAMGSKAQSKRIMEAAGVPMVPGYHGADQSDAVLRQAAADIGYPVLVKASAGGGGKGMRVVQGPDGLDAALAGARREAAAAFGDDSLLIEKYLDHPRHVEMQVFGDGFGTVVHLFERDCSLQRRHQKVIEEAPAPDLPPEVRKSLGEAAVAAARAVDYVGAGTVEFLYQDGAFYFIEMNTRLQVEHPVTEMITGLDLVEWQLRVAAGEPLPLRQEDIQATGHAFEARVYAEDPANDFLPSTGTLSHLRTPPEGPALRVETGVTAGDVVSVHYDPMIAKLVVWDHDRASALRRLRAALERFQVVGVATNLSFLAAVSAHPAFEGAEVTTKFLDVHGPSLLPESRPASDEVLAFAALDTLLHRTEEARAHAAASADSGSPWHATDGWRLNDDNHHELVFVDGETQRPVVVHYRRGGRYQLDLPAGRTDAAGERDAHGDLIADIGGVRRRATVVRLGATLIVIAGGRQHRLTLHDPSLVEVDDAGAAGGLTAPMPGKIIEVLVAAGDAVTRGQRLIVLEAMKMEHTITAPADGVVAEIGCTAGDQVGDGDTLLVLADAPEDAQASGGGR